MRVVFDSNIFISALVIPGGQAEQAILRITEETDILLISREIINEVLTVLSQKFSRDSEEISRVALYFAELCRLVQPKEKINILNDKPDNRVIECAIAGKADVIVTGDKAMLGLKEYRGINIISLREYINYGADNKGGRGSF